MVNAKIIIENYFEEEIKLTNCNELGNVIKSQFDLYNENTLIFRNCYNLKKIEIDCLNLTGLEIEGCPRLKYLSAYHNKIKKVDLSGLSNLKIVNFDFNGMFHINLTGCENLEALYAKKNKFLKLDLTDNEKLRVLYCSYNKNLKKLEIKHLKELEILHCESCSLSELDCSNLKKLKELFCLDNLALTEQLSSLKIKGCESLEELDCAENELEVLVSNVLDSSQNEQLITNMDNSKIYCALGCGKYQDRVEITEDIWGNTKKRICHMWQCENCAKEDETTMYWDKPSIYGIKCKSCEKVLTGGEWKTCLGRNDREPEFICYSCYENRETVYREPIHSVLPISISNIAPVVHVAPVPLTPISVTPFLNLTVDTTSRFANSNKEENRGNKGEKIINHRFREERVEKSREKALEAEIVELRAKINAYDSRFEALESLVKQMSVGSYQALQAYQEQQTTRN